MSNRIVIVGGMGPQASLELHRRIIAAAAQLGARDNEDYPEILHASIPITDFINSGDKSLGLKQLLTSLENLHFRDDDQVIIACNTVHLLLPDLEAQLGKSFMSLVSAVTGEMKSVHAQCVGLLASPTTVQSKLYERPLSDIRCAVIVPTTDEIDVLEKAIRHILADGSADKVTTLIDPIISRMKQTGATHIILGCTELSVMYNSTEDPALIDPLSVICKQIKYPRSKQ